MRVSAVICEYNPFHDGHAHQIELMREAGADMVVAVMSGNFVQRGEPAVFDKFNRAQAALLGGADLVLEIPAALSTLSAGEFAGAGVAIARASGIVDTLCFGVEEGIGIEELYRSSDIYRSIHTESEEMDRLLREGATYPEAADRLFRERSGDEALAERMRRPNNILAAEYVRALEGSNIRALPLARDQRYPSSSEIRSGLPREGVTLPDDLSSLLSLRLLDARYGDSGSCRRPEVGVCPRQANPPTHHLASGIPTPRAHEASMGRAAAASLRRRPLSCYLDVSREMEGRLLREADSPMSFSERAALLKTRQYTLSRVRRALLHIVLGITEDEFEKRRRMGYAAYIRVLGFSGKAVEKGLMKALKDSASLPVVVKPADHRDLIAGDVYRDEIYYSLHPAPGEYTRSPLGPL